MLTHTERKRRTAGVCLAVNAFIMNVCLDNELSWHRRARFMASQWSRSKGQRHDQTQHEVLVAARCRRKLFPLLDQFTRREFNLRCDGGRVECKEFRLPPPNVLQSFRKVSLSEKLSLSRTIAATVGEAAIHSSRHSLAMKTVRLGLEICT